MWYRVLKPQVCWTGIEAATLAAYAAAASAAAGVGGLAYQAANTPEAPPEVKPHDLTAPPNPDDADTKARLAAAQARERRRKSGSLLTNPTSGQPLAQAPVSVKSLLGQ